MWRPLAEKLVALVGRPNVGKSTLFNRLVGGRQAIEEKQAGVTRDRLYARAEWLNCEFTVIDTGGLTFSDGQNLEAQVHNQAQLAIEEATVIVFLVDGRQGLTALDEEIAALLRRQGKPVILAVNKVESQNQSPLEFYSLGMEPVTVSAAHGLNIDELLDKMISFFPPDEGTEEDKDEAIRVAVVGRPNVGKSSFINSLVGEERVIVNSEPGTTRDAIDTRLERDGQQFVLIDTAGIRRKSRVSQKVEYYSVVRALRAIENADVCLLLLDASEGVTEQDQRIAGHIVESGKAMIVALNKWDLLTKARREQKVDEVTAKTRESLKFALFAPVVFTSIYEPRRLKRLFPMLQEVYAAFTKRIPTSVLNRLVEDAQGVNPPPSYRDRKGRIYFATQPRVKPPTFVFFANDPSLIHFSYIRYLENRLREAFGFNGTPLRLLVRQRQRKGER